MTRSDLILIINTIRITLPKFSGERIDSDFIIRLRAVFKKRLPVRLHKHISDIKANDGEPFRTTHLFVGVTDEEEEQLKDAFNEKELWNEVSAVWGSNTEESIVL